MKRSPGFFLGESLMAGKWSSGALFGGKDFCDALALARELAVSLRRDPRRSEKLKEALTPLYGLHTTQKVVYTVLGG